MSGKFVYDDACGFCSWWARFFANRTDMGIVGYSTLTDEERERLPADYEECIHYLTEEAVYSCGAAIEEPLREADLVPGELFDFLNQFGDYEHYRERAYREAADRRDAWGFFISEEPPARREPGESDG
jgi:predicted DCC family thiol-disulfide oxidoreductase YuxK